MADYTDRIFLDIDGTIVECTSLTPSGEVGLEPVNTMNRANKSVGWTSGIPKWEFSCVVPRPLGGHVVNFDQMMKERTEFTATTMYQDDHGKVYSQCRISKIEEGSEEGKRTDTNLTIGALDCNDV